MTRVELYKDGKPSGTWELRDRVVVQRRTYGADGVLVAIDGRPVSAPPDQLALPDGTVLTRRECVRRAEALVWDGARPSTEPLCLDIFEQVQLCADEACKQAVIDELAKRR